MEPQVKVRPTFQAKYYPVTLPAIFPVIVTLAMWIILNLPIALPIADETYYAITCNLSLINFTQTFRNWKNNDTPISYTRN